MNSDPTYVTFKELISVPEREELMEYALHLHADHMLKANASGPNRHFARIWNTNLVTPKIHELASRIESKFGLQGMPVDQDLGWIISVIFNEGFVHPHKDMRSYKGTNNKHFRCNIMVSKPIGGGDPVIEGANVLVEERGGWAFFASETLHSSEAVVGEKPRIIYQFGYSLPRTWTLAPHAG